jgi:hypothetical protein
VLVLATAATERMVALTRAFPRRLAIAEGLALLLAPAAAFFVLRLALMSPPGLPDPSMHTTFILDPHDIFTRYAAVFTPTSRLREGARVGFLIPARIAYLLFGAYPGFIVFRYALALIAVVPTYFLLRRLYSPPAGALGVIVILSCPIIVTAWGTDFPDSAAVSYLIGGLACLAMPATRHRTVLLVVAATLFTMAVWAIASSAPLVAVTVAIYGVIRLARDRPRLLRHAAAMGGTAVAVTGLLAIASKLLLGPFDYIVPTVRSLIFLSQPSQVAMWHSANWQWAPYVAYLLVPPAVVASWFIAFGPRVRGIPTPQLLVGLSCAAQLAIYVWLQFAGGVQVLEVHYFSSLLWAAVALTFAFVLVELGRPLLSHPLSAWLLPLLVLGVALVYEGDPHVPAFGWVPQGVSIAAILVVVAAVARLLRRAPATPPLRFMTGPAVVLMAGCALILSVAPSPDHAPVPHTVSDPPPAYASALGGDATLAIDQYRATAELPAFVGPAAYPGEQLLMWWPADQVNSLLGPTGIFHFGFNSVPGSFGTLDSSGRQVIEQRQPAQILLLSTTGEGFADSFSSLGPFRPELMRTGILRSGPVVFHVWLIDLLLYLRGG